MLLFRYFVTGMREATNTVLGRRWILWDLEIREASSAPDQYVCVHLYMCSTYLEVIRQLVLSFSMCAQGSKLRLLGFMASTKH